MKPLNYDDKGCNFTSSDCVIWQGPDIECIKLCKGDSVSDVVFKLATELCSVLDTLNISTYDISCLNLEGCAPKDFHAFLQSLIDLICKLQDCCVNGVVNGSAQSQIIGDTVLPLAPIFEYVNPQGDTVFTMPADQYIVAIGNKVNQHDGEIDALQTASVQLDSRVDTLEVKVDAIPSQTETLVTSACLTTPPGIQVPIEDLVVLIDRAVCQYIGVLGSPTDLYAAIAQQCVNLGNTPTASNNGSNYNSYPGWSNSSTISGTLGNLWIAFCDSLAAIRNLQAQQPSGCAGIFLNLTATFTAPTNITFFLSGTIPSGFANTIPAGSLYTISDESGGSFTGYVDMVAFINNPSGFVINPIATVINTADNLHVRIDVGLTNSSTNATCNSVLLYDIINQANCPTMTYTPTTDSIVYSGVSLAGTATYEIEVYDNTGVTLLYSQVLGPIVGPAPIAGVFSSLPINQNYLIRVIVTIGVNPPVTCQFTPVSLIPTVLVPVPLGSASSFVWLANNAMSVTSGTASAFIGNVGTNLGPIFGINPPDVTGILYPVPGDPAVLTALTDLGNALAYTAGLAPVNPLPADDVSGTTITPGYWIAPVTNLINNGVLTLDALGDVNGVFVIYSPSTIDFGNLSSIVLAGGADWNNVFFVATTDMNWGDTISAHGTFLVQGNFVGVANSILQGRILVQGLIDTAGPDTYSNV